MENKVFKAILEDLKYDIARTEWNYDYLGIKSSFIKDHKNMSIEPEDMFYMFLNDFEVDILDSIEDVASEDPQELTLNYARYFYGLFKNANNSLCYKAANQIKNYK